jgi:DNA-binding MarR family transcriptional regulator
VTRSTRPDFDHVSEPLRQRVATGLHKLGLALKHRTWALAHAQGLSPTQGQILTALASDGPLSASEVASRLGVSLPTVSDAVATLVVKRLARKASDPRHPRARLLHLTTTGARRAATARTWPDFLTPALGTLSDGEQTVLLMALMKMIRTLQEQGQIPTSRMCATCVHFRPHAHDGPSPHHCAFIDAAMAERHLRLECPEHMVAPPDQQHAAWARLTHAG